MPDFLETTANTLRTRWQTEVETALSIPTAYENAPFSAPSDSAWAQFELRLGGREQVSAGGVGSRRFRLRGQIVATLHHPLRSGDAAALALTDAATTAFRATSDSGVYLLTPSAPVSRRDGSTYQTQIEFPFYADEIA
jgi:hypothetical protein